VTTVFALGFFLLVMWRREARSKRLAVLPNKPSVSSEPRVREV
jgi:hypothetical protein